MGCGEYLQYHQERKRPAGTDRQRFVFANYDFFRRAANDDVLFRSVPPDPIA
jgi:hypothetical protein